MSHAPHADPHWQTLAPPDLESCHRRWLFDRQSLTRRLSELSAGRFSVTPISERWQTLRDDDCQALGLPLGSDGWVREVYLCGAGVAWVYARSVAARASLEHGALGIVLGELGTRSLGELLFSDPGFDRQAIEVCHYPAPWLPVSYTASDLLARRSRFDRGEASVLVCEIFLPAFWQSVRAAQETS